MPQTMCFHPEPGRELLVVTSLDLRRAFHCGKTASSVLSVSITQRTREQMLSIAMSLLWLNAIQPTGLRPLPPTTRLQIVRLFRALSIVLPMLYPTIRPLVQEYFAGSRVLIFRQEIIRAGWIGTHGLRITSVPAGNTRAKNFWPTISLWVNGRIRITNNRTLA